MRACESAGRETHSHRTDAAPVVPFAVQATAAGRVTSIVALGGAAGSSWHPPVITGDDAEAREPDSGTVTGPAVDSTCKSAVSDA